MNRVIIIAEAGVNHNGEIDAAHRLVDAAAAAKVDFIKFQTFLADQLATKKAVKADYQTKAGGNEETQIAMLRKLELSYDDHLSLINHCQDVGVKFFSTAFDQASVAMLAKFELDFVKVPSGEITNLPYLRKVGQMGRPVILSTGMASLSEIESAIEVLENAGAARNQITVLHCNTEYPTPMQDVNLRAMVTIQDAFKVKVGYSDHTLGIEVPIAAVAMGACVIEKHFTLDRTLPGPDHAASLEPDELRQMVSAIRNIELAKGDGIKRPSPSELPNRNVARKSIVAATAIQKGEVFSAKNLTVKRPGTGISPMLWDELIGKRSLNDYQEDDLIQW